MVFSSDPKADKPGLYSPLSLAFLGDAVYEVYVRTRLLARKNAPAAALHKRASAVVRARAQAASARAIAELLTEEEGAVFRRGRNAKSSTVPKSAELTEYRAATGLEALFGYLYLKGAQARLEELMALSFSAAGMEDAAQN